MAIGDTPYTHIAHTAADTQSDVDATGCMASLSNLVPNPTTMNQWVPRPAAVVLPSTAATTPGVVSSMTVHGSRVYGLLSSGSPARDIPFAYDLISKAYVAISGIATGNTPLSQPTAGDWVPPTSDMIGTKVMFTHPNFAGISTFIGWIDTTNPAALTWNVGNTATNALPAVPSFVKQFNNRATYVVNLPSGAATYSSNSLDPLTITNPFIITYGDTTPIVALEVLGLSNLLGGITHALLVFKANNIYQVTGDFSASPPYVGSILSNSLNIATGTAAPLSVTPTPRGVAFMSPQGIRIIDWQAKISPPLGTAGSGIAAPFINALYPSRVVGACTGLDLRYCVQNGGVNGQPVQDWVFDLTRNVWHGPHTFSYRMIVPYIATYIIAPVGATGLWQSDTQPLLSSTYVENGSAMSWTYTTSLVPSANNTYLNATVDTKAFFSLTSTTSSVSITATDQAGASLGQVTVSQALGTGMIWGTSSWGVASWGAANTSISPHDVPWKTPLVFSELQITITGTSSQGIILGSIRATVTKLSYGVYT